MKGTSRSQRRKQSDIGGLTPILIPKTKEEPCAIIGRFRSSFKNYLHWEFAPQDQSRFQKKGGAYVKPKHFIALRFVRLSCLSQMMISQVFSAIKFCRLELSKGFKQLNFFGITNKNHNFLQNLKIGI